MQTHEINGCRFYYEKKGHGPPLLLIAGLASDSSSWGGIFHRLARHFTVIAYDNRSTGRTEAPESGYNVADLASDAAGLLDFLEIPQAHILGHSLGGFIAQQFCASYPEKVLKCVLSSTAVKCSARNAALLGNLHAAKGKISPKLWFSEFLCWIFSRRKFNNPDFLKMSVAFAVDYPYQQTPEGFAGQLEAIANFNFESKVKTIKTPTLVLSGDDDILIPSDETRHLARVLPNAEFATIKSGGHAVFLEHPEIFSRKVTEFLKGQ